MIKKILVLGANGMLGGSLFRFFSAHPNYDVLGMVRSPKAIQCLADQGFSNTSSGIDIIDQDTLGKVFYFEPDVVFNCIGLIKQVKESTNPIAAVEINALLPHRLAKLCTKYSAKLIHFSTDCVFSGSKGNYLESDIPDATDIYGRSKLLGEVGYDGHLTLRTSIIGHELNSDISLIDWFLSQHSTVKGFSRAVFSGLPTCCIAEFIDKYIFTNPEFSGVYHLSVNPIDKLTLLSLVKDVYGVTTDIQDYPDFEIDRSLNSDALRTALGFVPPLWSELIEQMNNEYVEYFCRYEQA